MRYLLDTGILLRILHRADPLCGEVRNALRDLAVAGHSFVTTRQNIAEFWNVCTRPAVARGGFGLSTDEAGHRLRVIERFVTVLGEPASAYARWKFLVRRHNVLGRQVHDARIAATMSAHRVKRILTLNDADFVRFAPALSAHTPSEVLGR